MMAILHRGLYYLAQQARGEPVGRVVRDLEWSQGWSRENLLKLQWQRQLALLRHCWDTVPWYRERWQSLGLDPGSFQAADWQRLPPLEKTDIQQHASAMRSGKAPAALEAATSGSEGKPVSVLRSHLSWAHAHANVIRGWHWHGIEVGDRYAYFWGVPVDAADRETARRKDWFFNRERCSAFAVDAESARRFYETLVRRPARWAFGYPSALTRFAEDVAELKLDARHLGWKAVVTTAEMLNEHQREIIGATFGCPVVDSYGCAEAGVAGFECEHGTMHVPVESVVVETIPAEDGQSQILLTDLHNFSQPLIRYRVGDLVEPAADTPCACERSLPALGRIQGRAGDTIHLADGRRMNANKPSYIFKKHGRERRVSEYQFVQFDDGRIELRIVAGPQWTDDMREKLMRESREVLGVAVEVKLLPEIPRRGRGKHRDFVREGTETR